MSTRTADKVMYLDFDGVLHHESVYRHPKRGIYMGAPGHALLEWMPILEQLLAPHPSVAIVLSTSWVRVKSYSYAKAQLSPALQARVIGATWHSRLMHPVEFAYTPRGLQILEDVQRRMPNYWFALDDDEAGWSAAYRNRLVLTKGNKGLSEKRVQAKVAAMLEQMEQGGPPCQR